MERIAIVTGAARGIGLAITNALLRDGCTVVGVDRDEQTMARASRQHREAGASFTPKIVDLTEPNLVHRVFDAIEDELGGVDALVNNAGTCFMNDFIDISPAELQQQMAVNFDSAFYCCQCAIPTMLKRPGVKKIVNISSNGAYNFDVFDPAHCPLPGQQSRHG
jgi:NAD(P)-dependent dehydrogenase (short-subunit alcohol dehydrogenase family)